WDVRSVAFGPDGKVLASAGTERTALLWDLTGRASDREAIQLEPKQLEQLWAELANTSPLNAFRAVVKLSAAPGQAVPFLKEQFRLGRGDAEGIRRLLGELDAEEFAVREKASADLRKLGKWAEPVLKQALQGNPSAEVRRRVETLLKETVKMPDYPELRRLLR